jgi:hypothetical protein
MAAENSSEKSAIVDDITLHSDQEELQIHLNTGYFYCPVCPKARIHLVSFIDEPLVSQNTKTGEVSSTVIAAT